MKKKSKKGQTGGLDKFILSIVTVAVMLGIGLIVLSEFKGTMITTGTSGIINSTHYCAGAGGTWNGTTCTSGTATLIPDSYTATGTIIEKIADIPTWVGIVIVVAMAFLVMGFFYGKAKRGY